MNTVARQLNLEHWIKLLRDAEYDHITGAVNRGNGTGENIRSGYAPSDVMDQLIQSAPGQQFLLGLYALSVMLAKIGVARQVLTIAPFMQLAGDAFTYILLSLEDQSTPAVLLERCRAKVKDAASHADYDFSKLKEVATGQGLSDEPWYSVGYAVEGYNTIDLAEAVKFRLFISVKYTSSGVEVSVQSSVYAAAVLDQLATSYLFLLQQVQHGVNGDFTSLSLLDASSKTFLHEYNNTGAETSGHTLVSLFQRCVTLHGDNTALVAGDNSWTYRELASRVAELRAVLGTHYNIGRGDIVAVLMDKSDWMVVSLLAILQAGAAYLPIDKEFPQERIDFIIDDARPGLIIWDHDQTTHVNGLPAMNPRALKSSITATRETGEAGDVISINDKAYIIYTSGSTGKPKGVMIDHAGVVNRIEWMRDHYAFTDGDRILQKTTYVFDVSVWELFLPMTCGAALVLCPREAVMDFARLLSVIDAERITTIHFVPSIYDAFLKSISEKTIRFPAGVRHIFVSGEALRPATVFHHYSSMSIPLHNLYGPTEASVDVSYFPVSRDHEVIPIGRPIRNMRMYVLDTHGLPLPPNLPGQIALAGVGLATGYLNRVELTAERFVHSPLNNQTEYLTGDLGRLNSSGEMEYINRLDNQVKVRGFRIELGEVERALCDIPEVEYGIVCAHESQDGQELVAIYCSRHKKLSAEYVLAQLGHSLPSYMIPARYYQAEALAFTLNGKLDRKKLLQLALVDSQDVIEATEGPIEDQILLCWREVLQTQAISRRANFFGIGGTSLKVIALQARLQHLYPEAIEIHEIFSHNTIMKQAELIASRINAPVSEEVKITEIEF